MHNNRQCAVVTTPSQGCPSCVACPNTPARALLYRMRYRVFDGTAEPIRMIRCMFGEVDGLLVLGGQEVTQPEGLTWLPLPGGGPNVVGEMLSFFLRRCGGSERFMLQLLTIYVLVFSEVEIY